MANAKSKKDNIIVAYFVPFGIKQLSDILMLLGAILAIIGAFTVQGLLLAGLIVFLVGSACMIVKNILVLKSDINRKSPEYRNALSGLVVVSIMFIIALFGLIYSFAM